MTLHSAPRCVNLLFFLLAGIATADPASTPAGGEGFVWPDGQQAAVTLTYDDALPVQLERVVPRLNDLGLHATFYLSAGHAFTADPLAWRPVAEAGHELGNHTLFHPCTRTDANASWVKPYYDLSAYTAHQWENEVRVANAMLKLIDGRSERSFGNTCHETTLGRGADKQSLSPLIAKHFVAGRGPVVLTPVVPATLDLQALGCFSADRKDFETLKGRIDDAVEKGGWLILVMHGVGKDSYSLYIDEAEHEKLLAYLAERKADIWTAPLVDVATHVKSAGFGDESPAKR